MGASEVGTSLVGSDVGPGDVSPGPGAVVPLGPVGVVGAVVCEGALVEGNGVDGVTPGPDAPVGPVVTGAGVELLGVGPTLGEELVGPGVTVVVSPDGVSSPPQADASPNNVRETKRKGSRRLIMMTPEGDTTFLTSPHGHSQRVFLSPLEDE